MTSSACEWDKHPALPRSEVRRIADLMVERHGFMPLDHDMVNEVAYFVYVTMISYNRLYVYNPRNARKIHENTARVRAQLRSAWQTLFVEREGKEILYRMGEQPYQDTLVPDDHVNMEEKVYSYLTELLSRLPGKPNRKPAYDPTSPFSDNVELIRCDINWAIADIPFNGGDKNFPSCNGWLSGYALPIIYFTTYDKNRTGGSSSDGHDRVGPIYTFVQELYRFITGTDIWGDTIRKNMRALLKPRLHWIGPPSLET